VRARERRDAGEVGGGDGDDFAGRRFQTSANLTEFQT
jgi:hypothetical protein